MLNLEVNVVIIPYRYAVVGVHPGQGKLTAVKIDQKNIFPHDQKDDIMLLKLPNAITDIESVDLPTCEDKHNKKPEK